MSQRALTTSRTPYTIRTADAVFKCISSFATLGEPLSAEVRVDWLDYIAVPCLYRAHTSGYYAVTMRVERGGRGGQRAVDLAQTFNALSTRDNYAYRKNSLSHSGGVYNNPVTHSLVQASTHSVALAHLPIAIE